MTLDLSRKQKAIILNMLDGQLRKNNLSVDKIFVGNATTYDRQQVLKFVESLDCLGHDTLHDEVIAFANEYV